MARPKKYPQFDFPGIYQALNLVNGKRYVGQAQNIAVRIREHRRKRNGTAGFNCFSRFYRAVKKYGWNQFTFAVLERVDDLSQLDEREEFWIKMLDACNPKKGYNICANPKTTRGWRHTEESKAKMRAAACRRTGKANPFFGKKHSDEVKQRIGAINAARPRSEAERFKLREAAKNRAMQQCRPVEQVDPRTNTVVCIWPSIKAACQEYGISIGSLVGCCQGLRGRKTAKGWAWRYASC